MKRWQTLVTINMVSLRADIVVFFASVGMQWCHVRQNIYTTNIILNCKMKRNCKHALVTKPTFFKHQRTIKDNCLMTTGDNGVLVKFTITCKWNDLSFAV